MKNRTALAIGFILVFSWSCKKEQNQSYPVFKADYIERFQADEYFDEINYIELKGDENALFVEPTDIEFFQGKWYIFDEHLKRIICFYENGDHVFTIDAVGKGPGEYTFPESMVINRQQEEIWLLAYMSSKLLRYDLSGKYIGSEDVGNPGYDMVLLDKKNIMAYNRYYQKVSDHDSVPPGLYIMDSRTRPKKQILSIKKNRVIDDIMVDYTLSKFNDTCYFLSASDSLLSITADQKVHVVGLFDFGKFHLPLSLREIPWTNENLNKLNYTEKVCLKEQLVPARDHFFMRIGLKHSYWFAIIDRKTNEMKISQGFANNLGPGPFVFPIGRKDEDELVGFLSSDYLLALQESMGDMDPESYPEYFQFTQEMIDNAINGTGNILVTMKLKKISQ